MADEKDVEKQQAPASPKEDSAQSSADGQKKDSEPQQDDKKAQEADKKADGTDKEADKTDKPQRAGILGRVLPWVIMAVVVLGCAGAGFTLARLFAGSDETRTAESAQQEKPAQEQYLRENVLADGSVKTWFYEMEPVVANLDVPGATRYVRATLILEINTEVDEKKGSLLLEGKKPVLMNWLAIYLAGLTLEDIRGDRNQRRIQSQMRDAFNEKIFPDAKPQIVRILFKEFAIQ